MSLISAGFANVPGMQSPVETFERAYCWGPYPRYFTSAYIGSTAADPTNTPTWELRVGLVLGKQTATGTWVNYSPTATDGSQFAAGVLVQGIRMQDVLTGVNTAKFYAVMVSGGVRASNLIGLDNQARAIMAPHFIFDDNLPGNGQFEWQSFSSQTANYAIQPSDNFTQFDNFGSVGEVDFTLPPILNGYKFGFRVVAAQTLKVISNEGGNIVAFNNAGANSLAFSTGGSQIGGGLILYSNPAGTLWYAQNISAGANTITVA
jgi:Bacteriophage lambda head decoration protein D